MTDDDIIQRILDSEGSEYTDRAADRGGPTRWGITLADLPPGSTAADVQAVTADQARAIYRARYIHGPGFDLITNDALRCLLVDTGVLHGEATAARWLQAAVGATIDGVVGLETVGALTAKPIGTTFLAVLRRRIANEAAIVHGDPSQLPNLNGWIARSLAFLDALPA